MASTVLVAHPGSELYGSDRVLVETVRGLRHAGDDVVVTIPEHGPLVALLTDAGARVVTTPTPVLRKSYLSPTGLVRLAVAAARAVVPAVRLVRSVAPDAVLVNTVTVPLWLPVARLLGAPVVCHVHEAEGAARPLVRRLLAAPLLLARTVVCNSSYSRGVLTGALPRLAARTLVVHNGVPGPSDPPPARESLDGEVRLLYLGRLSERKGVDVAVRAVHELRRSGVPARLDVVGAVFEGYEWYEESLRSLVADLGLGDAVRLHGFHPDVWGHLADCDVLLVPSRVDEPFGNTAVEGVLARRPVVASATSGLLEATDGMTSARTVPPGDPARLADAVRAVVADWPAVREAATRDRDRARELYSPQTYRERVADVVARVRRGSPRPAGPGRA
ncbi:glycosyltransferase family 4 protein [Thalassiella azotivora]